MASSEEPSRLKQMRRAKLDALRGAGASAYPNRFRVYATAGELRRRFAEMPPEALSRIEERFRLGGRILALRVHGKTTFADLGDRTGRIQLLLRKERLGEAGRVVLSKLDVGDLVGVAGGVIRTRTGELSIEAEELALLAKCLRPLPEKWHGLRDVETRFRERPVDLLVNPGVREIFARRSRIIQFIREFLTIRDFLEVETPMMQPLPGGAAARPFKTHHNALHTDLYLRIAPELYLKRLVVGGLDRVFEINRNFRNEGLSTRHNPEFTMLEFYQAYATYEDLMALTEEMLSECARAVLGTTRIEYQGEPIDLSPPWPRITVSEAIAKHAGIERDALADRRRALEAARRLGAPVKEGDGLGRIVAKLVDAAVEPRLVQPAFLVDYPTEVSPLSRPRDDDPDTVERFEGFIGAMEIANGFSELNDPAEQRERFVRQLEARDPDDPDVEMGIAEIDEDYVRTLEIGMPPTAGEGVGIDRLVMLLADARSIREVILFPQLRPEVGSGPAGAPEDPGGSPGEGGD
jgi:lysyl-tRNA synthetase class 2